MRRPRLDTFDLNFLRVFDALFRQGSVNLAAGEIGITPSALSHALARLRQIFDDELFVKGPGGMSPTAGATELAEHIGSVLQQLRSIFGTQDFDPATSNRRFKLRANEYAAGRILPYAMARLQEFAPGVSLMVDCDPGKGVADELDASLIDLVIGTFATMPERLESEFLFADRWIWILRADHPVLAEPDPKAAMIHQPMVTIATSEAINSMAGTVLEGGVERQQVASRKLLEMQAGGSRYSRVRGSLVTNDIDIVPRILAQSNLVSLLPIGLLASLSMQHGLVSVPFEDEDSRFEHRAIWHQRTSDDPAIVWLRSIFRLAAKDMQEREEHDL